jgi:hypothetical protein
VPNSPVACSCGRAAASLAARGVRVSAVRLSQVHDTVKRGLTYLIAVARETGSRRMSATGPIDGHLYRRSSRVHREPFIMRSPNRERRFERLAEAIGRPSAISQPENER